MPEFITNINLVSIALIAVFVLPVIAGAFGVFSKETVRRSVTGLLESAELILGLVLSIYLSKKILIDHDGGIWSQIYGILPESARTALSGNAMLAYVVAVPILLFAMLIVVRLVTEPLYRYVLIPAADLIYSGVSMLGPVMKRVIGALWKIPKAAVTTVILATAIYFSSYFIYWPSLTHWASSSKEYQLVYNSVLYPALNSSIAKKIPVIVGDEFRKAAVGSVSLDQAKAVDKAIEKISGGNIKIIHYFNGVTLDEAVKSNAGIDKKAREIVVKAKDEKEKAYLLYKWISKNIDYDYPKAERIASYPAGEKSGSIEAFDTRRGICFDYSSLYVSMCRAVSLKVRFITGLGYSGAAWGDHAWNQVWVDSEKRWIDVDTTFGSSGMNYFDRANFSIDHKDAEVQGEW
ncbi:MAG TPA: transglutaminase-like domain-containing protein [Clostridia bacterium]|nr:transglutaminase-like domain-containing protein [Clostridia bacterium]